MTFKYRILTLDDIDAYEGDINSCYLSNKFIFDEQSIIKDVDKHELLRKYVEADDSLVMGIFNKDEEFLYGIVIYDKIRQVGNDCVAEVHIATDRAIWGHILPIYKELLQLPLFTRYYCMIPSIAVHAIRICKKLGFKKTGYIPRIAPYINSKGELNFYDEFIFHLENKENVAYATTQV